MKRLRLRLYDCVSQHLKHDSRKRYCLKRKAQPEMSMWNSMFFCFNSEKKIFSDEKRVSEEDILRPVAISICQNYLRWIYIDDPMLSERDTINYLTWLLNWVIKQLLWKCDVYFRPINSDWSFWSGSWRKRTDNDTTTVVCLCRERASERARVCKQPLAHSYRRIMP